MLLDMNKKHRAQKSRLTAERVGSTNSSGGSRTSNNQGTRSHDTETQQAESKDSTLQKKVVVKVRRGRPRSETPNQRQLLLPLGDVVVVEPSGADAPKEAQGSAFPSRAGDTR